jgi:hypothetical protein
MNTDIRHGAAALFALVMAGSPALAQKPETALLTGLTRDAACAPASPLVRPSSPLTIGAGREARKTLFGAGDAVVIRGGTTQGVKAGDEYFVRRVVNDRFTEHQPGVYPISVLTAGAVQIVEAQNDASIAIVTYGCDGIMEGDYLERYERPVAPSSSVGTSPDYEHPGRLILAAERRQVGGAGQFMVVDRGSDHGIKPGQQLTIFRRTLREGGPVANIGTATVFNVQPESSVVRIESSLDAVYVGDLVAIHR